MAHQIATTQMTLRLPAKLAERLRVIAKEEHRTMTAQIVYFLERAVEGEGEEGR